MSTKQIEIRDNDLIVRFDKFTLEHYELFLKTKKIPEIQVKYDLSQDTYTMTAPKHFAFMLGLENIEKYKSEYELPESLFDYQKFIVETALSHKRYAVFADTGLGKTLMFLTFAKNVLKITDRPVLILSPLQIINQTIEQAFKFFDKNYPIVKIDSRENLINWLKSGNKEIAITNYEKFIGDLIPELAYLGGIVADESSIFKNGGGQIKWNIVKSAASIEYKFSSTATPAPNDLFEYSSQLSFLFRDNMQILNSFWKHFNKDKKGNWKLKGHATDSMYEHMAAWSIYMRNPKHYGFKDNDVDLIPEPEYYKYDIDLTIEQQQAMSHLAEINNHGMFVNDKLGVVLRGKLNQLAKGFYYDDKKQVQTIKSLKPEFVANIAEQEVKQGFNTLIWTVYNEEADILEQMLKERNIEVKNLSGATNDKDRLSIIESFRTGNLPCLISKSKLLGYGLNFQNCRSMIYSGWNDSFEQYYQSLRRAYRYGQEHHLRVHIPIIRELENIIYENIYNKEQTFIDSVLRHESAYIKIMRSIYGIH